MKKRKSVFVILLCVLAVTAVGIFSACEKTEQTPSVPELSEWMAMIDDSAPITDLAIPGSHDSGTAGMISLCETQDKDFAGQLAAGARYFDVRVRQKGNGDLVFYHTLSSNNSYETFLSDISSFLEKNPSEFLILDYQHRDPSGDRDYDNLLFSMLQSALGEDALLCAPDGMSDTDYVNSLTIGDVRGKVLVTLGDSKNVCDYSFVMVRDADESVREGSVLHSPYIGDYNRSDSSEYVEKYLDEYIKLYTRYDGGICVLQGQLTGGILEDVEARHNANMSAWIRALKNNPNLLKDINVIMRDYLNSKKCCDIIELNKYKGYVAPLKANAFDAMVAKLANY